MPSGARYIISSILTPPLPLSLIHICPACGEELEFDMDALFEDEDEEEETEEASQEKTEE